MKKRNKLELATGFLLGTFVGMGCNSTFLVYNLLAGWLGWAKLAVAWWWLVPLPLAVGCLMSIAIADLHLEDY